MIVDGDPHGWRRWCCALASLALSSSCSQGAEEFNGYGIDEVEPGVLLLYTDCPVGTAEVTETESEVRITVDAQRTPNDCLDVIELTLDAPIGQRAILVDGREWIRTDHTTCRWEYGPDRECD